MKKRITQAALTHAMQQAVELKGSDYRQEVCAYRDHKGEPHCIVGVAVNILDPEMFAKLSGGLATIDVDRAARDAGYEVVEKDYDNDITSGRVPLAIGRALQAAQDAADNKRPWSEAYQRYIDALPKELTITDRVLKFINGVIDALLGRTPQ